MRKERLAGHTKLDLAKYYVAVAEGALRGVAHASLGALPLSLVPTFAVPLWTIFHAISLLQLATLP